MAGCAEKWGTVVVLNNTELEKYNCYFDCLILETRPKTVLSIEENMRKDAAF